MANYSAKVIKGGNTKLGTSMWSFNKLAGNGEIAGCKGTCGKYCAGCYNPDNPKKSPCYVFKEYARHGWDHATSVQSHVKNTRAMRKDLKQVFEDLNLQIKRARIKPTAIRIHASGEFQGVPEIEAWMDLARKWPEIPFYAYSKATDLLKIAYRIHKDDIPDNFYMNVSIWKLSCYHDYMDVLKDYKNVRAFVYMPKGYTYPKEFKINAMCPAYNEKGKLDHRFTCDKCGICYSDKAKVCGCYDH